MEPVFKDTLNSDTKRKSLSVRKDALHVGGTFGAFVVLKSKGSGSTGQTNLALKTFLAYIFT